MTDSQTKGGEARFLTIVEVGELLRLSPETLRYWAWRGTGPRSFKSGRRRLYAREDVEAWIAEQRRTTEETA